MELLIELPEPAKARIRAREAESEEQFNQVVRACEGDVVNARRLWGSYRDLHQDKLRDAIEYARVCIDEATTICGQYVFIAHANEYRNVLRNFKELEFVLAKLREAVIKRCGEHARAAIQSAEARQLENASADWNSDGQIVDNTGGPVLVGAAPFWRSRRNDFREYNTVENNSLLADWDSMTGMWSFRGSSESQQVFKALATMAARGFQNYDGDQPWGSWLDELRRLRRNYRESPTTAAYSQRAMEHPYKFGFEPPKVKGELRTGTVDENEMGELFGPEIAAQKRGSFVQARFQGVHGVLELLFDASAYLCLEFEAKSVVPSSTADSQPSKDRDLTSGSDPEPGPADIPQIRETQPSEATTAKQARAMTVARLVKELNQLKPQMFEDESEYNRLREVYPDFLVFRIAEQRPDLKLKILAIRGSTRHIRLAQELAAAHHGHQLSTIQDDWKDFKPAEFKRSQ